MNGTYAPSLEAKAKGVRTQLARSTISAGTIPGFPSWEDATLIRRAHLHPGPSYAKDQFLDEHVQMFGASPSIAHPELIVCSGTDEVPTAPCSTRSVYTDARCYAERPWQ